MRLVHPKHDEYRQERTHLMLTRIISSPLLVVYGQLYELKCTLSQAKGAFNVRELSIAKSRARRACGLGFAVL